MKRSYGTMKGIYILILLTFSILNVRAGSIPKNLMTIHGHVTDETGAPISEAMLMVKWTERENRSDQNGEFTIENVNERDTIVISHPGYSKAEFPIQRSKVNYFISLKNAGKLISDSGSPSAKDRVMDITGKIYDDKGNALPDAFVIVNGGNQGASTDSKGEFNLTRVPVNSKVTVTHISFFPNEFTVTKSQSGYQLSLRKNTIALSEVVVVSYMPKTTMKPDSVLGENPPTQANRKLIVLEQNPEFPGGNSALFKFLGQNIRYPTEASKARLQGRVMVTFTVNENGNIRNPIITSRLGGGLDEEVLRVILNMPRWTPAIQNGKTVSKEFTLPINFTLE